MALRCGNVLRDPAKWKAVGWRHVGVKGMGEIMGLWRLRYSRVKIHEAGESHAGWYGEPWSWQFS